ncbi:FadR/GntR family transcriptional regulator [Antarctobacter heliothermus]|nr:FadR/GntR family transcriptional regulator [Antarctobacter heliothermus]
MEAEDDMDSAPLVLSPGKRPRLSDQLYSQILEQIVSGRLSEGSRLPPEKEICEMFGVSRPVVRDALLRLRSDGLVQSRQGSGTFIQRRPAKRLSDFGGMDQVPEFLRVLELRMPVESEAARLAAERRTAAQLRKIEDAHRQMERDAEAGNIPAEPDAAFHNAIAAATGNDKFLSLSRSIQSSISSFRTVASNVTRTGPRKRIVQVLSEHTMILEAIQSRETEAARIAMMFHLERARRRVTDRSEDS